MLWSDGIVWRTNGRKDVACLISYNIFSVLYGCKISKPSICVNQIQFPRKVFRKVFKLKTFCLPDFRRGFSPSTGIICSAPEISVQLYGLFRTPIPWRGSNTKACKMILSISAVYWPNKWRYPPQLGLEDLLTIKSFQN